MRTDLEIVQLPTPLTNWGGLLGKNTIFTDPDFGTQIVRFTDGGDNVNSSLQTASTGSAGIWNRNDTMLKVTAPSSKALIYQFDPKNLKRSDLPVATIKNKCAFSNVSPGVLYEIDGLVVEKVSFKYVKGKWVFLPTSSVVCDFSKILPAGFKLKWTGTFDVSEGDQSFCVGFSEGGQNSAIYGCNWTKNHGYRLLNTRDGVVTGDWGEIGPITVISDETKVPFTMHEISQTPNPKFATLGAFDGGSLLSWEIATTKLVDSCISGHRAKGFLHSYAGGPGGGQFAQVAYGQSWNAADPAKRLIVPKENLPSSLGQVYDGDVHCGFGLISKTDQSIFWVSGQTDVTPFTSAWMNEIRGYEVATGTVYRACHTFNSGKSDQFIAAHAIAVPSPTGKLIAFCSDGMGTLGSQTGAEVGTLGVDCRADVFVARLVVP